jgi:cobalt/nickel transport protein
MKTVLPFLIAILLIAALIAPFASHLPDGLDWVAQKAGFAHHASTTPTINAPLPDYSIPGLADSPLGASLSGVIGALICFLIPFSFHLLRRK